MAQQITKKQHFVPQAILKNFSADKRRKTINIFNLEDRIFDIAEDPTICMKCPDEEKCQRTKKCVEIKNRFQKEFFYDEDNRTENFLDEYAENPASPVIKEIVEKRILPETQEDIDSLLTLISSLMFRTPAVFKQTDGFLSSNTENLVKRILELNNKDPNAAKEGKLELNQRNVMSILAADGVRNFVAFRDLELVLVENKTDTDFYISDHPVFQYNWLLRESSDPSVTGIFTKGLQLFLPLSPSLMLCLYDPIAYKYGNRGSKNNIEINALRDIEILNSFQIFNALSCIGFRNAKSASNIKALNRKYGHLVVHDFKSSAHHYDHEDGSKRTRLLTIGRQLKLGFMPSFVKSKKVKIKDIKTMFRNPELVEAYVEVNRRISEKVEKMSSPKIYL